MEFKSYGCVYKLMGRQWAFLAEGLLHFQVGRAGAVVSSQLIVLILQDRNILLKPKVHRKGPTAVVMRGENRERDNTPVPKEHRLIVAVNFDQAKDCRDFHAFVERAVQDHAEALRRRTHDGHESEDSTEGMDAEQMWQKHSKLKWDMSFWKEEHVKRWSLVYRSLESSYICRRFSVPPIVYDLVARMEVMLFWPGGRLKDLNAKGLEELPGGAGTLEYRFSGNFDWSWRTEKRKFHPSSDAIKAHTDPTPVSVRPLSPENLPIHNRQLPPGRRNVGPWMRYQLSRLEAQWEEKHSLRNRGRGFRTPPPATGTNESEERRDSLTNRRQHKKLDAEEENKQNGYHRYTSNNVIQRRNTAPSE